MKSPKKKQKPPAVTSRKGSSAKGVTKSMSLNGRLVGAMRERTVRLPMMSMARMRKAQVRMVQPKPMLLTIRSTMIGKMTPPRLEPDATMPKASARRRKNHVGTELKAA